MLDLRFALLLDERSRWESSDIDGQAGGPSERERVNITEGVRKYVAEHSISESEVIESGMQEKRKEFVEQGSEVYPKT